ncbi:MAG: hypothetical protein U1A28_03525 [Patescibacteria group bacterium]|nr:hypothetical protein [Patescibacteria group bacterium]
MNRPQFFALIFVLFLAGLGGYFLLGSGDADRSAPENSLGLAADPWQRAFEDEAGPSDSSTAQATSGAQGESGWVRFSDPRYGFSHDYPLALRPSNVQDDEYGGEVFLFEGSGAEDGFQIFISPFDEPLEVLTPERIREDAPDMLIESPQVVLVGQGEQFRALIFFSEGESIGRTREAWFIHAGYLYQLTAPAARDAELARVMGTWQFE